MEAAVSQMSMHHAELALRIVVGVVLGGLIGWERNVEDRHFGLRIHMLTSLAAAGFSVAALEAVDWARLQNIDADPFRILEAVVSGVALLAAGTIIKGDGQVKGLTTGVGLWLAGAIGVTAGAGMYAVAPVHRNSLVCHPVWPAKKATAAPLWWAATRRRRRRQKSAAEVRIMIAIHQALVLGLGLALSAGVCADGASIARTGTGAAPACQTCHGPAGEGAAQANFPRLAGLGAAYLKRQLDAFADGTRQNASMMPIGKALSMADRTEVAKYYAALPAPTTAPAVSTTAAPSATSASAATAVVSVGAT